MMFTCAKLVLICMLDRFRAWRRILNGVFVAKESFLVPTFYSFAMRQRFVLALHGGPLRTACHELIVWASHVVVSVFSPRPPRSFASVIQFWRYPSCKAALVFTASISSFSILSQSTNIRQRSLKCPYKFQRSKKAGD